MVNIITYRITLFFVCVGVVSGIIGYVMEDVGGDDWFDQSVPGMQLIDVSKEDVEKLQFDGGSGMIDEAGTLMKMANMLWSVFEGVFLITLMLSDFMVYDVNGKNLFAPVLATFQILIYVTYIVGAVQFVSNRSMKAME